MNIYKIIDKIVLLIIFFQCISCSKSNYYFNNGYKKHLSFEYQDALKFYNLARNCNPKNKYAYYNSSHIYITIQEYDKAILLLDSVINLYPKYEGAIFNRVICNIYLNKYDKAFKDLLYLREKEKWIKETNTLMGTVQYGLGDIKKAIEFYDLAILKNDYDDCAGKAEVLVSRGECKLELDDIKGAESDALMAIEENQYYGDAFYLLGSVYLKKNDTIQACNYYIKSIELDKKYYNSSLDSICKIKN